METPARRLLTMDPRQIELDPQGIRQDQGDLDGLATSIAAEGFLQPIGIRRHGDRYTVVYGGRRLAAALRLGLTEVPCLLLAEGGDPLLQQVLENVQRRDLGDMEKAHAFARVGEALGGEQGSRAPAALREEIGRRLGLSGRTIGRYLALLTLAPEVQDLVSADELSVTQAQHLIAVTPVARQVALAMEAARRGLSAAQVSRAAGHLAANPALIVEAAVEAADRPAAPPATIGVAVREARPAPRKGAADAQQAESGEEAEFWPDDAQGAAAEVRQTGTTGPEPATADRSRVFRIRSLDSFIDEVSRLARCVQDGDLPALVAADTQAAVKIELAARQLAFLSRAVGELANRP